MPVTFVQQQAGRLALRHMSAVVVPITRPKGRFASKKFVIGQRQLSQPRIHDQGSGKPTGEIHDLCGRLYEGATAGSLGTKKGSRKLHDTELTLAAN
jgi:hypothetical protein